MLHMGSIFFFLIVPPLRRAVLFVEAYTIAKIVFDDIDSYQNTYDGCPFYYLL